MDDLNPELIRSELIKALPPLERRVLKREIDDLSNRLAGHNEGLLQAILTTLDDSASLRLKLYTRFQDLNRTLPQLRTREEKNLLCLEFLKEFTPTEQLKEDRKAFDRWMDITAVRERARVVMHESDRTCEMVLHLLRQTLLQRYKSLTITEITADLNQWEISQRLENEFEDSPRWQNRVVVLKVWEGLIRALPDGIRTGLWSSIWEQRVIDILSTPEENTWVQIQAFKTMAAWNPEHCLAMIHHRFTSPSPSPDDVFLRSDLLALLEDEFTWTELSPILRDVLEKPDPSEHVRIQAGLKLSKTPSAQGLPIIKRILSNPDTSQNTEKIQAATAISLGQYLTKFDRSQTMDESLNKLIETVETALENKSLRVQMALVEGLGNLAKTHAERFQIDKIDEVDFRILQNLDRIISHDNFHPRVRRSASETRESIILNRDPDARDLMDKINEYRAIIQPGESFTLPADLIPGDVLFGRVLAWASVDDYGYYAQPGRTNWRIWRGEQFKRRAWRLLYEFTHPDPAKRQGFVHTTGRIYPGSIRAHSRYLAESSETKVPGERLFHQDEYSWRPYLPTVDDLLSACSSKYAGETIKIVSSEGSFTFKSSAAFADRFMIWWELTLNYRSIVKQRNVKIEEISRGHFRSFTQYMAEDLQLEVEFEPHRFEYQGKLYQAIDPKIALQLYPAIKNWSPLS